MSYTINPEARIMLKTSELIKLANINLNHFPKFEKYGLSNEIRQLMYSVYNLIVEFTKKKYKKF
jgi:hypothetical protein